MNDFLIFVLGTLSAIVVLCAIFTIFIITLAYNLEERDEVL